MRVVVAVAVGAPCAWAGAAVPVSAGTLPQHIPVRTTGKAEVKMILTRCHLAIGKYNTELRARKGAEGMDYIKAPFSKCTAQCFLLLFLHDFVGKCFK